jgi:hypothetical protein
MRFLPRPSLQKGSAQPSNPLAPIHIPSIVVLDFGLLLLPCSYYLPHVLLLNGIPSRTTIETASGRLELHHVRSIKLTSKAWFVLLSVKGESDIRCRHGSKYDRKVHPVVGDIS